MNIMLSDEDSAVYKLSIGGCIRQEINLRFDFRQLHFFFLFFFFYWLWCFCIQRLIWAGVFTEQNGCTVNFCDHNKAELCEHICFSFLKKNNPNEKKNWINDMHALYQKMPTHQNYFWWQTQWPCLGSLFSLNAQGKKT